MTSILPLFNPKRLLLAIVLLGLSITTKASTYYWVGGSGSWSDFNHHWVTSSGGGVYFSIVPSPHDTVIFDANSFSQIYIILPNCYIIHR